MLDLRTIGKVYFLLPLLQAAVSNEWTADKPSHVTSQRGLCARIPCHYRYPSRLDKKSRTGIWYNSENPKNRHIVFHSSDHSREMQKFQHRTRLSGDLNDDDCSLVIDNITQEDEGPYFFRIEFKGKKRYNYLPVTRLRVSDFTDKPMIFAAELVEGKSVNITCIFNTTCDGTSPTLTWVTPTDIPPSVSSSVTRWHNTLTYTSVLTMTPALKHHGQNLTCRVRYPSVSSEQSLTLTVQYAPQNLSITSPKNVDNFWLSMKEGIPTSILCSVLSFPVSNLTWRHLGVTLNATSSSNELWLEFPQVTPQQAGVYQCVAENEHGTAERAVTLAVEYAPKNLSITSPENRNNLWEIMKEGIATSILCSVQSFPASNLTWRHLGVRLNTTSSSNELWLEFPQVTPQQAGVYQCVAENEHGTAERAITLSVECGVSAVWITVLLTSSVILSTLLAGLFVYKCIQKWDRRTKEKDLEILDTTVSSSARLTTPQDTERQRTRQIPQEVSPVTSVGEGAECDPVYANLRELPGGGGPVRRGETVIYSELHFRSIGPA
ncbi:myelin-associated glycoprotein-like isoform X2 [Hemitrygon akajei]|uniref:myelin-associated glycoprotein-like isoform X2 n=1 Tax=Hemitrygon akajei TaxID=2704970 RepID=UPI003BF98E30